MRGAQAKDVICSQLSLVGRRSTPCMTSAVIYQMRAAGERPRVHKESVPSSSGVKSSS